MWRSHFMSIAASRRMSGCIFCPSLKWLNQRRCRLEKFFHWSSPCTFAVCLVCFASSKWNKQPLYPYLFVEWMLIDCLLWSIKQFVRELCMSKGRDSKYGWVYDVVGSATSRKWMFRSHFNPKDMDVKESIYRYCCMKEGWVDESHFQIWSGWVDDVVDWRSSSIDFFPAPLRVVYSLLRAPNGESNHSILIYSLSGCK
jgi:hypothetical protein